MARKYGLIATVIALLTMSAAAQTDDEDAQNRARILCSVISRIDNDFRGEQRSPDMVDSMRRGPGFPCANNYFGRGTRCWFMLPRPSETRQVWWIMFHWELGDERLAVQQRKAFATALKKCRFQLEDDIDDDSNLSLFLRTSGRSNTKLFVEIETAQRGLALLRIQGEPD